MVLVWFLGYSERGFNLQEFRVRNGLVMTYPKTEINSRLIIAIVRINKETIMSIYIYVF